MFARMPQFMQQVNNPFCCRCCYLLQDDNISTSNSPAGTVKTSSVIQWQDWNSQVPNVFQAIAKRDLSIGIGDCVEDFLRFFWNGTACKVFATLQRSEERRVGKE